MNFSLREYNFSNVRPVVTMAKCSFLVNLRGEFLISKFKEIDSFRSIPKEDASFDLRINFFWTFKSWIGYKSNYEIKLIF